MIGLARLPVPEFGVPAEAPAIAPDEYERRIAAFRDACEPGWLVVYGDREHHANLAYLTHFDPRFEEAVLVLGPDGSRVLLVGNEGLGYAPLVRPAVDVRLCQSLSLMGQDRSSSPTLRRCLAEAGIGAGARVGIAGWKYFEREEWEGGARPIAAAAFLVDALRDLAGADALVDVTPALMAPGTGLRTRLTAAEVAVLEFAGARASAAVRRVVVSARPGMSERDAAAAMGYAGEPLAAHVMLASGPRQIVGLRSPTERALAAGDAVTTAIGYWGSMCCRAGVLRADPDDAFTRELGAPYFGAITAWYETVGLGVPGGAVAAAVDEALAGASFRPLLNPGHLIHLDEWVHTPIAPGSETTLESGTALQCDIIPTPVPDGWALNCEDGVVLADEALREQLATAHPQAWERMQARRRFLRDEIGIDLADEVLPLSSTPAYLPPFWLDPELVYVRA